MIPVALKIQVGHVEFILIHYLILLIHVVVSLVVIVVVYGLILILLLGNFLHQILILLTTLASMPSSCASGFSLRTNTSHRAPI